MNPAVNGIPRRLNRKRLNEKASTGDVARTTVSKLTETELVEELCRMLGADVDDPSARLHAEALLA